MSQASQVAPIDALGQAEFGRRTYGFTPGKLAMWLFLASDAMGFVGLMGAYIVLREGHAGDQWWPTTGDFGAKDAAGAAMAGLPILSKVMTGFATALLIFSSYTMVRALNAITQGNQAGLKLWLGLTTLCGAAFVGFQIYEYGHFIEHGLVMSAHPAAATFYICTAFHGCHVLAGVIYLTCIWLQAAKGRYTAQDHSPVELVGLFWHFVDLVWIVLFTIIYLF
jgi:heme/copper-type cytochrome/quinol oxidase subunit 3